MANDEHVRVLRSGSDKWNAWRKSNPDVTLDLEGARLNNVHLHNADLQDANLIGVSLEQAQLYNADLSGVDLKGANLTRAEIDGADFSHANFHQTNLFEATIKDTNFEHARNLRTAKNLGTTEGAPKYFERCERGKLEEWIDWERFRAIGRLPLFSASYAALVLIPVFFYGLALYNKNIKLLQDWAGQFSSGAAGPMRDVAVFVQGHVDKIPIPSLSYLLLVSTLCLAGASTVYTFACPSRIKEYSRDQWCDELNKPLIHYWPLAWKHRFWRVICASWYALGGFGVVYVIVVKVWNTAVFIHENS